MKIGNFTLLILLTLTLLIVWGSGMSLSQENPISSKDFESLLSDPWLQLPTNNSVRVVWFTEFPGNSHAVIYGDKLEQKVAANTTKLTRIREDGDSEINTNFTQPKLRNIWRHEAIVTDLIPNQRIPYQVSSIHKGKTIKSKIFTLASQPKSGTPLKILLTSDHQLMPMTAANLQLVVATIDRVDGVFFAGDLVNVPDRASEWFDDNRGGAFFPCLQGLANYELEKNGVKTVYYGGEIIQHAPLFAAIGNHEVMGRFSGDKPLKQQFNDPIPQDVAEEFYQQVKATVNPKDDPEVKETWLKNNSFNTDTYEEIFSEGKQYYAVTFGDIRLIVLYVTNVWRSPSLDSDVKGRYQEKTADLDNPEAWGYGQHIFKSIAQGSTQYNWLAAELQSKEFQQAKYKIVMFHHPPHTLGGNIVPAYTDPQPQMVYGEDGKLLSRRYEYPLAEDYIMKDVVPLLESAGVQLVYYGHSHLWNRFVSPSGMHFLESSNVGNTYGAHLADNPRPIPQNNEQGNYIAVGDPNGLEPIIPTIDPL
jgi:hypothetical protein